MNLYKNTFQYQTSIIKILNVDIMHNYFEDGIFKKYEIQPNLETLNLLKNYNLIFKKTETGFVILFQKEETERLANISPRSVYFNLYENFISKRATLLSGAYLFLINSKLE